MKRKTSPTISGTSSCSTSDGPFVGPLLKHEKAEPMEPTESVQHLGPLLTEVSSRILGGEGYCTKHHGKYQDCPACLETERARGERTRAAGRHVSPRCENYHSGCTCKVCIKRWRAKSMWNRGPRCMMCPLPIKYDVGDGVCCLSCKDSLMEVQDYPFTGRGPNGEPLFKKTHWAKARGDKI
jgi:hypothetical protein